MPDSPLVPELMRSLRSFGVRRDKWGDIAHDAIFLPLLDARSHAGGASKESVLAAVRGAALAARIEARAIDAAVHDIEHPAQSRALTAQARELIEPLRAALLALDAAAGGALADDTGWDAWIAALQAVFHVADMACRELADLAAARSATAAPPRWYSLPSRDI